MRRGPRQRIASGIYRDACGLAAVVQVGTGARKHAREKRFPLDAPLETLRAWQRATRQVLQRSRPARGGLAQAIDRYLNLMRGRLSGWVSRRAELRAWLKALGDCSRAHLAPEDVAATAAMWLQAGVAPKTVNMRVQSLRHLCRVLDGRRMPTPCDEWQELLVPVTPKVVVPPDRVIEVEVQLRQWEQEGRLRDAKTRGRFMVLQTTLRRPSELMRAEPADVDLERRVWAVRSGKGGSVNPIYLNDEALAAWRVFIGANAWGTFREGSYVRTLRRAGWPAGYRPYQGRHSGAIVMLERGVDLADVSAHLGHRRIETTRRNYTGILGTRLQRASEAVDYRFGWATPKKADSSGHAGLGQEKSEGAAARCQATGQDGSSEKS